MKKIITILLTSLIAISLNAQQKKEEAPLNRILFVFDGSQSMLGRWESDIKINTARRLLSEMLDSLAIIENVEIALRVYGHQSPVPPQDCGDTKLEVPFSKNNIEQIKRELRSISPKGTTPIAQSLERSADDFPPCEDCRNIIILITDGIEACDGDPCAVSLALQKKGIVLKPFVIGIGLDVEFKETFECVGHYYDASNEDQFRNALGVVISQALNSTTAQVNLLDTYGRPTETNVNMTFYDMLSNKSKHNFIHTINHRGNPDTIRLDPLTTYQLVVHTIPPVSKDSIQVVPGIHNIIALDAPQGFMEIKSAGRNLKDITPCIIRKKDEYSTLNVQNIGEKEKYITGKYDIEVLSLPRMMIDDVEIKQSHTTTVHIPQEGMLTLNMIAPGYGGIYVEKNNELSRVCNLPENKTHVKLKLLPGNYRVVFRTKNAKETIYTFEKRFTIQSGSSESINIR